MNKQRAKQLLKLIKWESSGCLNMDAIKPDYPQETPEETRFIKDYAEKNKCFRLFDAYLKLSKEN